jgi:single-strand selective monofunctional uracil DNA glycosylase
MQASIQNRLLQAAEKLSATCNELQFGDRVALAYNAMDYAWNGYRTYIERFAQTPKKVVYMGMNPGPWGMAQTGVPFGEIAAVRDWLGIEVDISKPPQEHPKRPIEGFACTRSEVSGRRLWGLFRELYTSPEAFFAESIVFNYCPLSFLSETGANITPDKLPAAQRIPLEAACTAHLQVVIEILQPAQLIGIGGFATKCLESIQSGLPVGTLLHPSPASPIANREWPARPVQQLKQLGILRY